MKVTVFGIGYVGLVQAAVLAEAGHQVCCVDVNPKRVADLQAGIIPIYEPGLATLVQQGVAQGLLQFTTDGAAGVAFGELQFIAVGTPPDEDGSADLKYVLKVASTIASHMTSPKIVINKSTVPVGTGDKVKAVIEATLAERQQTIQFAVVSNPEFLKEGAAVADCQRPDRIIVMDIRSAELTKYAANCMLATKISFMNEMSNLAELLGADIEQVRHGIGSDPRIGYHFIYPGCGYGGSCFPKDVQALIKTAEQTGYNTQLLKSVEAVNQQQKHKLFGFLQQYFAGALQGKTIALWGLSFKPNTDDMREASSRVLMESLWQAGATVQAFDPEAMEETQRIYGSRADLKLVGTKEAALQDADVLVICTEWKSFRSPDFEVIKQQLKYPVIIDGRNLFEPSRLKELGLTYFAIGRGDSVKQFQ